MIYQDATGRRWSPRITCATLRKFERLTGADVFERVNNAAQAKETGLVAILDNLFSNFREMFTLVHLSATTGLEQEDHVLGLEEFLRSIRGESIMDSVAAMIIELFQFFPENEKQEEEQEDRGAKSKRPFVLFGGSWFLRLLRLRGLSRGIIPCENFHGWRPLET